MNSRASSAQATLFELFTVLFLFVSHLQSTKASEVSSISVPLTVRLDDGDWKVVGAGAISGQPADAISAFATELKPKLKFPRPKDYYDVTDWIDQAITRSRLSKSRTEIVVPQPGGGEVTYRTDDPDKFNHEDKRRAEDDPLDIFLVVSFAPQKVEKVVLMLTTAMAKNGNTPWLDYQDGKLTLKRGVPGRRSRSHVLSELGTTHYSLRVSQAESEVIRKWGKGLSYGYVYADADVERLQNMGRGMERSAARDRLENRLHMTGALVLADMVKNEVAPGMIYSREDFKKVAEQSLREVVGGYVKLRTSAIDSTGTVTLIASAIAPPRSVEIRVNSSPQKEGHAQDSDSLADAPVRVHPADQALADELMADFVASSGPDDGDKMLTDIFDFPLAAEVLADARFLHEDERVLGVERMLDESGQEEGFSEAVIFEVVPKRTLFRQLTLSGGFSYSPEKDLTAEFGADFSKMFEDDGVETLRFKVGGGEHSVEGEGKLVLPPSDRLEKGVWGPWFTVEAGAESRDTYRFGNLFRPDLEATEATGDVNLLWRFDSFDHHRRYEAERMVLRNRERWRLSGNLRLGFRARDFYFDSGTALNTVGLDEGLAVTPYLETRWFLQHDGRESLGGDPLRQAMIDGGLALSGGGDWIGSDFDYVKVKADAGLLLEFTDGGKDFAFFEHRWTGGWASSDAPTFDYFGAGDDGFVRGFERDELIGRSYIATRTEAGISVPWIFEQLVGDRAGSIADDGESGEKEDSEDLLSQGLPSFYLAAFADFGWLSDGVVDGVPTSGTRSLSGYGVHLRFLNLSVNRFPVSFSVGYAYSPQSTQHESGFAFSEFEMQF